MSAPEISSDVHAYDSRYYKLSVRIGAGNQESHSTSMATASEVLAWADRCAWCAVDLHVISCSEYESLDVKQIESILEAASTIKEYADAMLAARNAKK